MVLMTVLKIYTHRLSIKIKDDPGI